MASPQPFLPSLVRPPYHAPHCCHRIFAAVSNHIVLVAKMREALRHGWRTLVYAVLRSEGGSNGTIMAFKGGQSLGVDIYDLESDKRWHNARLEVETTTYEAVKNGGSVYVMERWWL